MSIDLKQLSKTVSHALRHEPQSYGITLDDYGWVSLSDLLCSLKDKGFPCIKKNDIISMIESSEKKRHQIVKNKIRANYGHSVEGKILKQYQRPPNILYHGTTINNVNNILEKGLLPMNRQYVHLSIEKETARIIASRRGPKVILFKINALEAHKIDVLFYKEENGIWLSDPIPPKYISK